jgi:peptidyl-prolyl cis-trans isomerase SurA
MRVPGFPRAVSFFAALIVLASLCAGRAQAEDVVLDGIVALVNGKPITAYELEERMRPVYAQTQGRSLSTDEVAQIADLRRRLLDQLIDDQLLEDEAARYKLKFSDQEVNNQVKEFLTKRNLTEEDLKRQLALQNMTREEFVRNMRRDMIKHQLIGGAVTSKVVVTDSEVQQSYEENKAAYSKDRMVQLSILLVPANLNPAELKKRIDSGEMTFADAVGKYSQGPGLGNGGDIGYIAWKDLAPEWSAALGGLKPGQVSDPVRVQDFAGLLKVVSIKEGEELPLDAVREQIYQALHQKKFEKIFQEYMLGLRAKAMIEYRNL